MINSFQHASKSPAIAGLFFILINLLVGCEPSLTPEQVTYNFWSALSQNNDEEARQYLSKSSRDEPKLFATHNFQNSTVKTGKIIIDADTATVETQLLIDNTTTSFLTVLIKENENWRIDYQGTQNHLSGNPFNGFFKSLEGLGEKLNQQLEQQLPKFEKDFEALGKQLEKQIEEFGRELEKKLPQAPPQPPPDKSI